jgi:hypothetical protein
MPKCKRVRRGPVTTGYEDGDVVYVAAARLEIDPWAGAHG